MKDYFVIFGGGGIRGISYCGAYKALLESGINLTGCAGNSIGAVFASLLSVGYDYDEIFDLLLNAGVGLFKDINFDIKKEFAVSKGQVFFEWIKEKIEQKHYKEKYLKGQMEPVTFKDIGKNLVIYAVNLTTLEFQEFSKTKTPDYEIARAIRASVSMPGLFTPLEEKGDLLVDGDLLKSAPLWRISDTIKNLKERILEFRLEDNETAKEILKPTDYINRVYNAISGFATDYIIDLYSHKDKFDYIKINTPDVSVVDFLITKEKRKELFDTGYQITKNYFRNDFQEKRKFLYLKYKKILESFLEFQKAFLKNNFSLCYILLCEIFIYFCEEKKYIDNNVFKEILQFKNYFFENYIKTNGFFFKKGILKNNKDKIYEQLKNILTTLTLKVEELN